MDFSGRQVVVTGGTGALGTAVIAALLDAGASCTVSYLHLHEAQHFAHRDHKNVKLVAVTDLADQTAVTRLFDDAKPWASIHIAGGFAMGKVADTDKAALMAQLDKNLISCFLCCRAAVNAMRASGQGGRIVNVASRVALEPRLGAGAAAYTIAKAGIAALTIALGEEAVTDAILVNAVAPSIMDTPSNRKAMPEADHSVWAKVQDVAATILFLASPRNTVTRGAVVPVYGRA
jgi:NAD(P)-dependent dehydrogenase (short-subunit alcohol dehydrogenase family)